MEGGRNEAPSLVFPVFFVFYLFAYCLFWFRLVRAKLGEKEDLARFLCFLVRYLFPGPPYSFKIWGDRLGTETQTAETNITEVIKMSRLKDENVKKCVSLLREFIDGSAARVNKKKIAVQALGHLQNIKAGDSGQMSDPNCNTKPRGDIPLT